MQRGAVRWCPPNGGHTNPHTRSDTVAGRFRVGGQPVPQNRPAALLAAFVTYRKRRFAGSVNVPRGPAGRCRYCSRPVTWVAPDGVAFGDGSAAHVGCYERAEVLRQSTPPACRPGATAFVCPIRGTPAPVGTSEGAQTGAVRPQEREAALGRQTTPSAAGGRPGAPERPYATPLAPRA